MNTDQPWLFPWLNRGLLPAVAVLACAELTWAAEPTAFVRVSPRDGRYLELSDGRPFVPIGLNLIHPDTRDSEGLARMEEWMDKLSANRGNFIRVWLSSPFWDVEWQKSGVYDGTKAERIDQMLNMAARREIRVKLTLEHFREMIASPRQRWANKPLHLTFNGGTATNVADFFAGAASQARFREKLAWLARRYGENPTIYGWELWNEVNAVSTGAEFYMPWTAAMLAELHRLFPHHLSMQSLGSFDSAGVRRLYRQHSLLPGNDVAQVHRYLDLGASLEVCRGPVDVLAADATREVAGYAGMKPVLLAESGAVEPRHSGPFKLYARDTNGMILHDVIFAPFFAGAAGAGQIWHWDAYVARNNLWHHFSRFAEAIKDLDPPAEHFEPVLAPHPRLRVYALKGRQVLLLWCRDGQNTWQTELEQGLAPGTIEGCELDLAGLMPPGGPRQARIYDPWKSRWSSADIAGTRLTLPPFTRSLVVRCGSPAPPLRP
jgi:hypothetical protein